MEHLINSDAAMVLVIQDAGIVSEVSVCASFTSALLRTWNFYIERDGEDSQLLADAKRKLDSGEPMEANDLLEAYFEASGHRFSFSIHEFEYLP